ncbi:MAG: diacylglycerol kinase family protein [Candidatus Omnitrophica bacterium]|nr:diacylglycerol kinase family protein [Candidatus Omnitrophota bacterium]
MAKDSFFRNVFKVKGFFTSLRIALQGIIYLFLYHHNMRLIFIFGILAFLAGIYFKLKGIELIALCITITLVFMAEIFNTAIELLMDTITEKFHIKIKLVKDIAAGVVVLACLNAIAIGYIIFIRKIIK